MPTPRLRRRTRLSACFYLRGLIELWGRGTQKIVKLCVEAGHPEPEFEERAGSVTVRFIPSGYTPPHRISHDLTERQRRILYILKDGRPWGARSIAEQFQPPLAAATLRRELTLLRDLGLVDFRGRGRGAFWTLRQEPRGPGMTPNSRE